MSVCCIQHFVYCCFAFLCYSCHYLKFARDVLSEDLRHVTSLPVTTVLQIQPVSLTLYSIIKLSFIAQAICKPESPARVANQCLAVKLLYFFKENLFYVKRLKEYISVN